MSQQPNNKRGATFNPVNKYQSAQRIQEEVWDEDLSNTGTQYIHTHPKTILNEVKSPDIPLSYSTNPYQGCEHGCVYCYARNTHNYWGYSAGIDFEQKILIKQNAPELLEKKFRDPKWTAVPIMLSGNTDCYQPAERKLKITRRMLEIFWKYRHPVSIITKNSLVQRDMDLLKNLASEGLVTVAVSITSLDEKLRRALEPRTATSTQRLNTVKALSENGIPVFVMIAPIIPGLNDHEILAIAKAVAEAGAIGIGSTTVRLNGDVGVVFEKWIHEAFPDRADKVLDQIASLHGGKWNDSRFGKRMRGEGNIADVIHQQIKVAKLKYFKDTVIPPLNCSLHQHYKPRQLTLF